MILKSYLHIKTRHLFKIISKTPTCFSLSGPFSGSFVLSYFEVANASMLNIQDVPGGKDLTSGECSLGQTITI